MEPVSNRISLTEYNLLTACQAGGTLSTTSPLVTPISSPIWFVVVLLQVIHLATSRVSEPFMTNLEAL